MAVRARSLEIPVNGQLPSTLRAVWSGPASAVAFAIALAVSGGYLAPAALESARLPPFLAYLLGPGSHWLVVLAVVTLGVSLATRRARLASVASRLVSAIEGRPALGWAFLAVLAGVGFTRVPDLRRELVDLVGDEPKSLRIAMSLVNDTDVDISGGRETPPDIGLRLKQLASVARSTGDAVGSLVKGTQIPPGHRWDAGNWSVHGLHGGVYHLQPPGFPALLAAFIGFGQAAFPERSAGGLAAAFLVCCWVLGAVEIYKLARDVLASRAGALAATGLLFATAPVFVGGYHLYPESLALVLIPFCYRRLRASERPLGSGAAFVAGLVAGGLWWIHPKFVAPSLALLAIGLLRPRASARTRLLVAGAFAMSAGSSLLYVHRVTGLLRPEGLYLRQAQEYQGVPPLATLDYAHGLANGLVGARDGILVLAPVLLLGLAALPAAMAARRRTTLELGALFGAVWLTAAVHWGISIGPPARLFVPVAFVPMLVLALAIREVGPRPRVLVPVLLLSLVSIAVTARTASNWRLAFNPYRGLFTSPAQDFTRNLPSRDHGAAADLARAALVLGTVVALGLRWRRRAPPDTSAEVEALGLLAAAVALAFGLGAVGNELPGPGSGGANSPWTFRTTTNVPTTFAARIPAASSGREKLVTRVETGRGWPRAECARPRREASCAACR